MKMGYAKLFSSITESSLWGEPKEVRLLFVTMLARADATGFMEASRPGLSRVANLTTEEVEKALAALEGPDPHSKDLDRAPEHEGRRILKVEGGWMILNYEEYRNRQSEEERREYMRNYMKEYRLGKRKQRVNTGKQRVTPGNTKLTELAQADAYASGSASGEREEKESAERKRRDRGTIEELRAFAIELGLPADDGEACFHKWEGNGWKNGHSPIKDWKATIRAWKIQHYLPSQRPNGKGTLDKSKTCRLRPGEGIPVWDPMTKKMTYMEPQQ